MATKRENKTQSTEAVLDRINSRIEDRKRARREQAIDRWGNSGGFISGSNYEIMESMGDPHAWGSD